MRHASLALLLLHACPANDEPEETGTPSTRYHPDDFLDPAVHSPEAKLQVQECVNCHGADLTGGTGTSCDTCHPVDWRTDCTFCHGGEETADGAPPSYIHDDGTNNFPVHTNHVSSGDIVDAFACTDCHVQPTDVLSEGHLFLGDDTPGAAEVAFSAGLSKAGTWDGAGTCSNLYCHGNGQGDNGTASAGTFEATCDGCHPHEASGTDGWKTMSGQHDRHLSLGTGFECGDCHKAVVEAWEPIKDTTLHVNGTVELELVGSMSWSSSERTCTGECHEEHHEARRWEGEE